MSTRVQLWDADALEMRQSAREYDSFSVAATVEDYAGDMRPAFLTLYVDPATGVVVRDVTAYEISIGL